MPLPDWYKNTVNTVMPGFSLPPQRPGPMAAGRRAERSVPIPTAEQTTAIMQALREMKQQQEEQQIQQQMKQGLPIDPMTGMPNIVPRYDPSPTNVGPHTMAQARQQEIAGRNDNPLVPQTAAPAAATGGGGGGGGATPANVPLPPRRPPELGGTGQPMYYTMDPGDGGILRTFLSKDGKPPEMAGYTAAGSQPVPQDQGILARLLRGAF